MAMEVLRLVKGKKASADADCITIELLPSGRARLMGSLLANGRSVSLIEGGSYDSQKDAEAAGVTWASEHRVRRLYVEVFNAQSS